MRKIDYPPFGVERKEFEEHYISKVSPSNISEINCHLSNFKPNGDVLTFQKLAIMSFDELLEIKDKLKSFSKTFETKSGNEFTDLFDYSNKQQNIAKFFRSEKTLNFRTCFYCNIDYINSFKDIKDYEDGYVFLNNADENELQLIYNLGEETVKSIMDFRDSSEIDETNIDSLGLFDSVKNRILALSIENSHDHFTLDHFLPQNDYPFFSLCLYNFVPSCYACNSKFKKALILPDGDWKKVSPTSELFSIHSSCKFLINFNKTITIASIEDFNLSKKITDTDKELFEAYFKIFKIEGRYTQHKDIILHLIQQKNKYPDEKISDLSKKLKVSRTEIKKLIFGKELFEKDNNDLPLIKLKKDIAEQLRIL